jgi:glycerophosphoryl diester phosphodiesterase
MLSKQSISFRFYYIQSFSGIVPLAETRRQGYSNPHSPTTMTTSHKIHLRDFASHVMDMTADSGFKFSEEYEVGTHIHNAMVCLRICVYFRI